VTIRHEKKERADSAGIVVETRIDEEVEGKPGRGEGRRWTDGHAKGARGCATTTPQPPANSAAARRSARSTGSNATTAYNTSPSRSPAVYLAAATLLRSACFLRFSLLPLSSPCSSSPAADSHTPPLSFTCVHTRGMMRVSLSFFFFPLVATPRGNACGTRFASGGGESRGSLPRYETAEEKRDVATPTSTPATTS